MPGLKSYHQPSPLTMHSVHSSSSSLAAEGGGKAEIIAKLATDPEAVSIMREVLMSSKDSRDKLFNFREEGTASVVTNDEASQSEATPTSQSEATPTSPSGQSDHLPSPPTGVECKSVNSSLVTYDRHTSSTSTTTDRSESLTLSEAAQIGSLVLSRETDNTFDHDDFLISSPSEGKTDFFSSFSCSVDVGIPFTVSINFNGSGLVSLLHNIIVSSKNVAWP